MKYKYSFFIIIVFILINLINFIFSDNNECERNIPFLKNGECISFCSKEELNSGNCTISTKQVKIQYLTNIILLGNEKDYQYININSNENNDIIIQTSKSIGTEDRLFYGLKSNGRFFFKNENQDEIPTLLFNISKE